MLAFFFSPPSMCLDDRRIELFATSVTLFKNYPFVHNVVSRNNEGKHANLSPICGVKLSAVKVPLSESTFVIF